MRRIIISLLVFVFTFFVFSVSSISAKVITDEKGTVNIGKTEVINDDLFVGAQTVEIAGTVNGDVFIGAQTVKISGIVNGNLHVGANTIDLGGTVKGNVYAGGQSILINGSTIGGSLLVGAATINIDKNTTIGGSIMAGAGAITMDSQIKRSVYAGTGSLTIGGNTRIGKDLYYTDDSTQGQANISPSAKIAGSVYKSEVNTVKPNVNVPKRIPGMMSGAKVFTTLISFAGALIIYLLYSKLFGRHLAQTKNIISNSFWKSIGVGFLVTIAIIPGIIILLITIIGIPVAGLALTMLALYSSLAKILVGSVFGEVIVKKFSWKISAFWAFAIGLLVIDIVKFIPVFGPLVGLAVFWTGLGALTVKTFSKSE